jgi:hypothetical protein
LKSLEKIEVIQAGRLQALRAPGWAAPKTPALAFWTVNIVTNFVNLAAQRAPLVSTKPPVPAGVFGGISGTSFRRTAIAATILTSDVTTPAPIGLGLFLLITKVSALLRRTLHLKSAHDLASRAPTVRRRGDCNRRAECQQKKCAKEFESHCR